MSEKLRLVKFHARDWARGKRPRRYDRGLGKYYEPDREYQHNKDGHCCLGHDQCSLGLDGETVEWIESWPDNLRREAIGINDDPAIKDPERYAQLKRVFALAGRELVIEGLDG